VTPIRVFGIVCPCETALEVEDHGTVVCENCGRQLDDRGVILSGPTRDEFAPGEDGP
jgi:hypothetical protein